MAIHTYGVTVQMVEDAYPDSRSFGAPGASGVTTDRVQTWIERGSAKLTSLIVSRMGETFDVTADLDEADTSTIADAVVHYAVAAALRHIRKFDAAKEYRAEFDFVRNEWAERSQNHSTHASGSTVVTLADVDDPEDLHWGSNHSW